MGPGLVNMGNKFGVFLLGCVFCLVACTSEDAIKEKSATKTRDDGFFGIDDAATGMTLWWKFNTSTVTFEVVGQTTGWVAVGFEPTTKMNNANIIIGYVNAGAVSISDDFGSGLETHSQDSENNLSSVTGNETAGVTTIRFTIPKDSGDSKDKALSPGLRYTVMLAKGPSDDFTSSHTSTNSGRTTFSLK